MSTASLSLGASVVAEARDYWNKYLWHHRHPMTRELHRIGSWVCIAGMAAAAAGAGWYWVPISIVIGYGFAFAGHYLVEGNKPLTLKHPVRAAIGNWFMFFYEFFFSIDDALRRLEGCPPDTHEIDDT